MTKALIEVINDNKEFKAIKRHEQNNNTPDRPNLSQRETHINCKFY